MAYLPQLTIGAAGFGENFTTIGLVQQVLDVLLANDHITVDTHDKSHPPTDMGMPTHGFKIEGILLTTGMSRYIHLLPVTIETSANMTFDCLRLEPSEHFHFQTRAGLNADYRSVPYNNMQAMCFDRSAFARFDRDRQKKGYSMPSIYQGLCGKIVVSWRVTPLCDCEALGRAYGNMDGSRGRWRF